MTFTITENNVYLGIIIVLVLIQLYQQRLIKNLEKELDDVWSQMGTLVASITAQLVAMQKDKNDK
jgi:hypothetical protein